MGDPAVALLVWALLRHPEAHYLPVFPEPAEVYPAYAHALAQGDLVYADGVAVVLLVLVLV